MGITGLLPFLEQATRNCNISEFRGSTVAIDTYCWLHKGATACADVLARGEETNVYVTYCMKYIKMLKNFDIKPIMVFDGNHLPAKVLVEKRRRESRKNAKTRAAELLRLGKKDEAWNFLRQCVDITPEMAFKLIQECRKNDVDCIVAPYESDAQLAYLNMKKIADLVITEDSDLILFGCSKVFYKLDMNGNGRLVETEKIPICMKMKPDKYTFDKFRYMCVLSGCDYLDSLPGIGLKKALKFVSITAETDPKKFLDKVPRYLNMKNQIVSDEYKDKFMVAIATFQHQIVYDPIARKLTYLTDPALSGTSPEHCRNAGEFIEDKYAYQIAVGNMNPFNKKKYDDWSPSKCNVNNYSIWSNNYIRKISRREQKEIQQKEKMKRDEKSETNKVETIDVNNELSDDALHFESMLSIYYSNKKKPINRTKNCDSENTPSQVKNNESDKIEMSEPTSPILRRVINPFLKKRLSKFNSTSSIKENNVIVRSKYFHSKSDDVISNTEEKNQSEETEDKSTPAKDLESDNVEMINYKKRKISSDSIEENENITTSLNSNKDVDEKTESLSSHEYATPKKSKLLRCQSEESTSTNAQDLGCNASSTNNHVVAVNDKIGIKNESTSQKRNINSTKSIKCRTVGLSVKSGKKQLTLKDLFSKTKSSAK